MNRVAVTCCKNCRFCKELDWYDGKIAWCDIFKKYSVAKNCFAFEPKEGVDEKKNDK